MKKIFIPLLILGLLILSGCAASSLSTAEKSGATPLNAEEIFSLVNNNTLHMVASDFDAYVFCNQDGTLSAKSIINSVTDEGGWDIKSDNKLCIKFTVWYFGDLTCFSVYQEAGTNRYLLFTNNGALAFTVTVSAGNSQGIKIKTKKEKEQTFLRSSLTKTQGTTSNPPPAPVAAPTPSPAPDPVATSGPGASSEEINHTVKSMAKDCPGCNFQGADLRKADLVGANLKGADLRGADLSRANLRRANLENADLSGATILSANMPGANLRNADLSGADLTGSNLIHADFTDATMDNTILENTLREGTKGLKQ